MNQAAVVRWMIIGALAGGAALPASAEEPQKTLPTLLIKGEVVSVDTNDPAATLLKVKDRYGFETPIYLSQETKITQGDQAVQTSTLAAGTAVEVEYNFDINTAKRHAVNVKLSQPTTSAQAPAGSTPAPASSTPPAEPAASSNTSAAPASTPAAAPAPSAPAANTTQ